MFALKALLKCLIVLQCLGLAMLSVLDGAGVSTYLFLYTGVQESYTIFLNYIIAGALSFIAFSSLFRVKGSLLLAMAFIFATEAFFKTVLGGSFASSWTLGAHIVRYGWPLLVGLSLMLDPTWQSLKRRDVLFFLRVFISITFIVHGIEALMMHPKFIDFIIVANSKFPLLPATESFARNALVAIGIADILVALIVIVKPTRSALLYMVFWGALTASARVVYADTQGFPDAILRAPHWAIPGIILILQKARLASLQVTEALQTKQQVAG